MAVTTTKVTTPKLSGILEIIDLFPESANETTCKYRVKAYAIYNTKLIIIKVLAILSPVIGAVTVILELFI